VEGVLHSFFLGASLSVHCFVPLINETTANRISLIRKYRKFCSTLDTHEGGVLMILYEWFNHCLRSSRHRLLALETTLERMIPHVFVLLLFKNLQEPLYLLMRQEGPNVSGNEETHGLLNCQ